MRVGSCKTVSNSFRLPGLLLVLLAVSNAIQAERLAIHSYTTIDGLVRFNPKAPPELRVINANELDSRSPPMFTVITPEEESLYARAITVLIEGRDGTIWCGTYHGVYRLERAQGRFALRYIDIGMTDEHEGRVVSDLLQTVQVRCG